MNEFGRVASLKRRTLIAVLIGLALVLAGCGALSPNVEGMALAPARAALESAGFQVGAVTYDPGASASTGTVIAQVPAAGQRTGEGSFISLTVAGPRPVAIPNVVNLDKDEAGAALVALKLSVGDVTTRYSASVPAGGVMSQIPAAGEVVLPGSTVSLAISKGPKSLRVPLVKGRTEARATERLKSAGFKVRVVRAGSAEEQGTVIAQKPSRGRVSPGKTITITVSTGVPSTSSSGNSAGGGSSDSDDAAARAFEQHKSGIGLSGEGTVTKVLADDNDGGRHQRFILRLASGQTLLIAHNIDIAPRVPSLATGDSVAFKGVYEWNSQGGVVHWTHHDPSGDHTAGWLKHDGSTYQ